MVSQDKKNGPQQEHSGGNGKKEDNSMNYLEFEPNGVSNGLVVGVEGMGILR